MSEAAYLRYSALGVDDDVVRVMERSYRGFKAIYDHLKGTQQYLQRPENVARSGWRTAPADALGGLDEEAAVGGQDATWIELAEPEGGSDHELVLFERFFDEYTNAVYVTDGDDAEGGYPRRRFDRGRRIGVLERVPDRRLLLLEAMPVGDVLEVRPNTYIVDRQLAALRLLQNQPLPEHLPLLRLVQEVHQTTWPDVDRVARLEWQVLTDSSKPGADEQRRFVKKALATPDFAILEGPPGSGKTTTICELIVQLILQGKRVMLCGSTHVAVDNVLERLTAESAAFSELVLAVRIGDRGKCSERVRHLRLDDRVETERRHLMSYLNGVEEPTLAQETFLQLLTAGARDRVQRLVLDVANVVCGTTIGILQHPDIRAANVEGGRRPLFDVLIVDEASKTTLHEFLVPAVLAKRWILAGDVRQLSPHVDEEELRAALEPAIRTAPLDAQLGVDFLRLRRREAEAIAVEEGTELASIYLARANALGVPTGDSQGLTDGKAQVAAMARTAVRKAAKNTDKVIARLEVDDDAPEQWAAEVAWRLSTRFQQRLLAVSHDRDRFDEDLACLLPPDERDAVAVTVDRLERVAMPSILESLQTGYGTTGYRDARTALTEGLPEQALLQRYEKLRYQYRMHPDISAFPRREIYADDALRDAQPIDREWSYRRYKSRVTWLDVRGASRDSSKSNDAEVRAVMAELDAFAEWVTSSSVVKEGRRWSVAVVCFYRDQERALRRALRSKTGQHSSYRYFDIGPKGIPIQLDLCTVDGFQGQEADLVFVSIALPRTTAFTRSLNRVNVALTRARYQLVVVGNQAKIKSERPSLLQSLAKAAPATITWEQK